MILVSILSNRGGISDLNYKFKEKKDSESQSSLIEAVFLTLKEKLLLTSHLKSQSSLIEAVFLTTDALLETLDVFSLNPL